MYLRWGIFIIDL